MKQEEDVDKTKKGVGPYDQTCDEQQWAPWPVARFDGPSTIPNDKTRFTPELADVTNSSDGVKAFLECLLLSPSLSTLHSPHNTAQHHDTLCNETVQIQEEERKKNNIHAHP